MNKKILYYSTDKLYKIKNKRLTRQGLLVLSLIATLILIIASILCFNQSITLNKKNNNIKYNEKGNIDYKIYLKDNNYYENSYLNSGMQYVASLIKTINVKFNYNINSSEYLNYNNKYKINSELQITEKDDPSKILFSKKENLIKEKYKTIKDNNILINEEIDIDYDKYNNIVNSYKKDLGLVVSSNLIITLETDTTGSLNNLKDKLNKNNKLQIIIPLSEATLQIKLNTNKIDKAGTLNYNNNLFTINNNILFILLLFLLFLTILSLILNIYIYIKYFKKDIYKSTINKILKNYDRLIVTGNITINEEKYSNIIYPDNFDEMVDAAQNLNVPILYYEPIPNEKSFFVVVKEDTLYKYRLTKAFLQKNPNNKKENKEE